MQVCKDATVCWRWPFVWGSTTAVLFTIRTSTFVWTKQTSCGVGKFTNYQFIHLFICMFHTSTWEMDYKWCSVITNIHFRKNCLKFGHPQRLTTFIEWTICTDVCFFEKYTTFPLYTELSTNGENDMLGWTKNYKKKCTNSTLLSFTSSSISYEDTVINPERYILPSSLTMLHTLK